MFYSSSKHPFDIMFVILCVIAGASSHIISNTSRTPPVNQLPNRYRTSFVDFILDASLIELLQSSNTVNGELSARIKHSSSDQKNSATARVNLQSQDVCALLSNILTGNQIKFCHRHQGILETVLPQVIQLTKKECARITNDLKWNCTMIEPFLDRSNSLSITKEGALIRSILNASMMYLTIKICSEHSHRSCGCQTAQSYQETSNTVLETAYRGELESIESMDEPQINSLLIDKLTLSSIDLKRLDAGSPVRLTKSMIRRKGCLASVAFANAFTKVFLDSDDIRSLNRAYKILNEDFNDNRFNKKSLSEKRLVDSDYKDLSFIKWTKSAINLHNNHVGRQMVREATQRQCRCHGLSGVCQFQTCWDQLPDFSAITTRLRTIYLVDSVQVEVKNLGLYDKPDLYLAVKSRSPSSPSWSGSPHQGLTNENDNLDPTTLSSTNSNHELFDFVRVKSNDMIYLYESPEYCEPQPNIKHQGTRGRPCTPESNVTSTERASKEIGRDTGSITGPPEMDRESINGAHGSCKQLCCNRGYHSVLALDMVTCNCRFTFCCRVECEHCLRQRMQHFCL